MLTAEEYRGFEWHNDLQPFERDFWSRRAEGQAPKHDWLAFRAWLSHAMEDRRNQVGPTQPTEPLPDDAPLDAMALVMAVAYMMRDEFTDQALSAHEVRVLASYLNGLHMEAVTGTRSNADMLAEFARVRGFLWRGELEELRPALVRHEERTWNRR